MAAGPGLVIVGSGPAGTAAAKAFRELDRETPVTLISREPYACYSRPRLPEVVAGMVQGPDICLYPENWYREQRITLQLRQTVVALNPAEKNLKLDTGSDLAYERLILATGAQASLPPIAGLPTPKAFVLRTLDDALALRQQALGQRSALLIGGGLLGLEAGYALTRLGLKVTVIEVEPRLLPRQVDEEGSALLLKKLLPLGFEFHLGARVRGVESDAGGVRLELDSGLKLLADLALVSAGILPNVEIARAAGLRLGKRGVEVDDHLAASLPDIWAAGDLAEWRGGVAGLWNVAQAMGNVAGRNAAGRGEAYPGVVLATKLKVAGIDLWSQGDIRPEGATLLSHSDPAAGWLMKLFVREERLAGSLQIGRTTNVNALRRLIERRVKITGFEENLFQEGFDFTRLPGYQDPAVK
ncbi:MAG: FAD-dependent oxidoreductase [candidate division FCPU426 bacterium]